VLVGAVAVLAVPEKSLPHHQPRQRRAVLALGGLGEVEAHDIEALIGQRRRQGNRDGLVRLGWRRGWRFR